LKHSIGSKKRLLKISRGDMFEAYPFFFQFIISVGEHRGHRVFV
jgi:hypothetical protein